MGQVEKLMMLQELEQRKRELEEAREQRSLVQQLRTVRERIQNEQTNMREHLERYQKLKMALQQGEEACAQLRHDLETNKKELYSGEIVNPRELESFQERVDKTEHLVSSKEERVLDLMEEKESLQKDLARWRNTLEQDKDNFNALKQRYEASKNQYEAMLNELPGLIDDLYQQIDPELLKKYQTLSQEHNGRAVAALKGQICQGCHMQVSWDTNRRAKEGAEIIFCENCGRFLFSDDPSSNETKSDDV